MTISISLIRKMILVAMVLIVFSNIAQWVGDSMHKIVGAVWGGWWLAGVAYYCRVKATQSHTAGGWIRNTISGSWCPPVLTVVPLVIKMYNVFTAESQSWWVRIWYALPVVVNFILPVTILWVAYAALTQYMPQPEVIDQAIVHDE